MGDHYGAHDFQFKNKRTITHNIYDTDNRSSYGGEEKP